MKPHHSLSAILRGLKCARCGQPAKEALHLVEPKGGPLEGLCAGCCPVCKIGKNQVPVEELKLS